METRNIAITLEKAKEWYNSNNNSLKQVALQAFTEEELNSFDFTKIKTFKDACDALNINYVDYQVELNTIEKFSFATAASFKLNIIRKALNKDQNIDLLNGELWYPYTLFISMNSTYEKLDCEEEICKFEYQGNIYKLFSGHAIYGGDTGLGDFYSYFGVGHSHAAVGFLGCATKEIAEHFGKYFAKEIFNAKYGDLIDYVYM